MRKLLTMAVAALLTACSSIDCPVQTQVTTQYVICDHDGEALELTGELTVTSTRKDGSDVTLLNLVTGISAFSLPVSYSHPEDELVFCFTSNLGADTLAIDTVWVKKDDFPHFESVECSASFFHELTSVRHTHNIIDSLVILNRSVTYDQTTTHFRLVPKTDD